MGREAMSQEPIATADLPRWQRDGGCSTTGVRARFSPLPLAMSRLYSYTRLRLLVDVALLVEAAGRSDPAQPVPRHRRAGRQERGVRAWTRNRIVAGERFELSLYDLEAYLAEHSHPDFPSRQQLSIEIEGCARSRWGLLETAGNDVGVLVFDDEGEMADEELEALPVRDFRGLGASRRRCRAGRGIVRQASATDPVGRRSVAPRSPRGRGPR